MSNPNTPKDTSYLGAAEPKKEETHEQVLHNVQDAMTKSDGNEPQADGRGPEPQTGLHPRRL
jgi:hypothetical protein